MKDYVNAMARFFGSCYVAINLLNDQEFAILAVLATMHLRKRETSDYISYRVIVD